MASSSEAHKTSGCHVMQAPFKQEVLTSTGPCIKLKLPMCSFISRVQRLFFLNEAQNLSSFLIADLGVAKYPSYAVTRSRSVFTTRQDLLDYEQALQHAAELDNALEVMSLEGLMTVTCTSAKQQHGYMQAWSLIQCDLKLFLQ